PPAVSLGGLPPIEAGHFLSTPSRFHRLGSALSRGAFTVIIHSNLTRYRRSVRVPATPFQVVGSIRCAPPTPPAKESSDENGNLASPMGAARRYGADARRVWQ